MAHVITGPCAGEVYAACMQVCPADCILLVPEMPPGYPEEGRPMAVIDPHLCIGCGACEPACPVQAIVDDEAQQPYWAEINRRLAPSFNDSRGFVARAVGERPRRHENEARWRL